MHVAEIVRFPVVGHIILNACAKSVVESMVKGIIAIANLGGILIELNHIFHDSVSIAHPEMFKGILGISDSIKRTEIGSKFVKEGGVGVLPCWQIPRIWVEEVWFKPVKGGAREKGNGVVDFTGIHRKSSGLSLKFNWRETMKAMRATSPLSRSPNIGLQSGVRREQRWIESKIVQQSSSCRLRRVIS